MVSTDEIQVAPGSCSLARQPDSIKQSKLFYNLRQIQRSQRQGGPGSRGKKGEERGTPVGESRSTGGENFGPNPAGFPGPVPAVILGDLSRAVAILQSVRDALLGPTDNPPSGECTSRAGLLVELSAFHRERSLTGPLLTLLELLAE